MFLSIMALLQTNLPCSANFTRYKKNYEKFSDADKKPGAEEPEDDNIRLLASPKVMRKLSPIA